MFKQKSLLVLIVMCAVLFSGLDCTVNAPNGHNPKT